MATIHKCDKCGKTVERTKDLAIVKLLDAWETSLHPIHTIDLCPDCREKLIEWLWPNEVIRQ